MKQPKFIRSISTLCLILVSTTSSISAFQTKFEAGSIYKDVTSISDNSQSYDLFLPSKYTVDKVWPILFAMDPRARGIIPLNGFLEAADSLGYIIMSSNNSLSDGDADANVVPINTMINDAFELLSIDSTRFYFAGFSGTARNSWTFAFQLRDYTAGIIGVGAANSNIITLAPNVNLYGNAFSFYGLIGFYDYNYLELIRFGQALRQLDFNHHIQFFDGYHQWPRSELLNDALYWMELRAMKENRIPKSPEYIQRHYSKLLASNNSVILRNDPYELNLYYQSIKRTFDGLYDLTEINGLISTNLKNPQVKKTESQLLKLNNEYYSFNKSLLETFERFRTNKNDFDSKKLAKDLKIKEFASKAFEENNVYQKRFAKSLLELIFVHAYFYQARDYIQEKNFKKAYAVIQLGEMIYKDDPRLCLQKAKVYSQLGNIDAAFNSLNCLQNNGRLNREMLEEDPNFEPLRNESLYFELLRKLDRQS